MRARNAKPMAIIYSTLQRVYGKLLPVPILGTALRSAVRKIKGTGFSKEQASTNEIIGAYSAAIDNIGIEAQGNWSIRTSALTSRPSVLSRTRGDKLLIDYPDEIRDVKLVLLKHPWSGICRLDINGRQEFIDLYSQNECGEIYEWDISQAHGTLALTVTGTRHGSALDAEVCYLGLEFNGVLQTIERGKPLSKTVRLIDGDWGKFLTLRNDIGVAEGLAESGVWAGHDIDVFKQYIDEGDVVLDIGANFGHHSVVFSKIVGEQGLVVAFEPQSVMFQLLNANVVLNGLRNAKLINCALGDTNGSISLFPINYDDKVNFGALGVDTELQDDNKLGESVPIFRLDNKIDELIANYNRLDFIKIDVQTYELYVLLGAQETLKKYRPTLFLEISPLWMEKTGYDYRLIYGLLNDLGYSIQHPQEGELSNTEIKQWDGSSDVEWDILAIPTTDKHLHPVKPIHSNQPLVAD